MMSLNEFKKYLPKDLLTYTDEKLEALLLMFHKMAAACIEISRKRNQKENKHNSCIRNSNKYSKEGTSNTLSDNH